LQPQTRDAKDITVVEAEAAYERLLKSFPGKSQLTESGSQISSGGMTRKAAEVTLPEK
jgi:hypothetical protein